MKLLWLCNVPIPDASKAFGTEECSGGGWMIYPAMQIRDNEQIAFHYVYVDNRETKISQKQKEGVTFWRIPQAKKDQLEASARYEKALEEILDRVKPDIIHIWGTEHVHSYSLIQCCERRNLLDATIISIQGLVSIYAKHYYAYLPDHLIKKRTLRDFIKKDSIRKQKIEFEKRGVFEKLCLKKAKNVIGRTDWDKACTSWMNPKLRYYANNEILRSCFYEGQWNLKDAVRHSIFVSQGQYPIKGLHLMLEAMKMIVRKYPDAKLVIAGRNIISVPGWRQTSYQKYIIQSIKKWGLSENITFTGVLKERAMKEQYLKAHVFVCPSSIENSPNSVGEAMLLGVPVVSSDVGGVKNLMKHEWDGFIYPADAPYMLASYVCRIFEDAKLAEDLSGNARHHAAEIYDREANMKQLLEIYNELLN